MLDIKVRSELLTVTRLLVSSAVVHMDEFTRPLGEAVKRESSPSRNSNQVHFVIPNLKTRSDEYQTRKANKSNTQASLNQQSGRWPFVPS